MRSRKCRGRVLHRRIGHENGPYIESTEPVAANRYSQAVIVSRRHDVTAYFRVSLADIFLSLPVACTKQLFVRCGDVHHRAIVMRLSFNLVTVYTTLVNVYYIDIRITDLVTYN